MAALFLLLGVDERTLGVISDEQQLAFTSVSLAEFGEIGIARGQPFAVHRPAGDAVAPYGIGAPLVYALASAVAPSLEASFGVAASQSAYALLQTLLVLATALCAGLAVRLLSGTPHGIAVAVLGTAVASPLRPYTSTLFSEPLLALALVGAMTLAIGAIRAPEGRRALFLSACAGAVAGFAVLTKSLALGLVPFVLLPLFVDRSNGPRRRRLVAASASLAAALAVWLALEIYRFGKPLASYGGQGFTHPLLDGLWRLTVGPNKGLFLYFPLSILAVTGLWRLSRRRDTLGSGLGIAGTTLSLLLVTAAWWAWDGSSGWGPRLLVPLVPVLGAAAGAAVSGTASRTVAWTLVAVGTALNGLGVLQPDSSIQRYLVQSESVAVTAAQAATLPPVVVIDGPGGAHHVAAILDVSNHAELSPFRLHAWILRLRLTARAEQIDAGLLSPPWRDPRPRDAAAFTAEPQAALRSPFRWQHLFSALSVPGAMRGRDYHPVWAYAIGDQVNRAVETGRLDRVLELSERLFRVSRSHYPAALRAEALRLAGRRESLGLFLRSLPREFLSSPRLGVVLALDARDRGDEVQARRMLRTVAASSPRSAILQALESPVSAWPRDLRGMWGDNRATDVLVLPGAGTPPSDQP